MDSGGPGSNINVLTGRGDIQGVLEDSVHDSLALLLQACGSTAWQE